MQNCTKKKRDNRCKIAQKKSEIIRAKSPAYIGNSEISEIFINFNVFSKFSSVLYFLLFFALTTILCQFNSENDLLVSLRNVFTPTSYAINNFTFYYPDVYKIIIYLLVYFFSHYIFMITYDVSEINTGYLVGFLVSMLIGFILDQMLYTTIYYLPDIIMSNLTVIDFLKTLTSNFIVTLISSIILLIFVPILNIKNKNNK